MDHHLNVKLLREILSILGFNLYNERAFVKYLLKFKTSMNAILNGSNLILGKRIWICQMSSWRDVMIISKRSFKFACFTRHSSYCAKLLKLVERGAWCLHVCIAKHIIWSILIEIALIHLRNIVLHVSEMILTCDDSIVAFRWAEITGARAVYWLIHDVVILL